MDLKRKAADFALVPMKKPKNEIVLRKGSKQQQLVASVRKYYYIFLL